MNGIRVYLNSVTRWAPSPNSALPPSFSIPRLALKLFRREPAISSSFGISPLPTPHPTFQRTWVRSSSAFYRTFNLDMGRSRSTHSPYSDSLSLRLRLFNLTSHAIVTRRFILQKAHHPLTGSNLL